MQTTPTPPENSDLKEKVLKTGKGLSVDAADVQRLAAQVIRAAADALEHNAEPKEVPADAPLPAGGQEQQAPRKPWPRWKMALALAMTGVAVVVMAASWPAREAAQAKADAARAAYLAKHPEERAAEFAGSALGAGLMGLAVFFEKL